MRSTASHGCSEAPEGLRNVNDAHRAAWARRHGRAAVMEKAVGRRGQRLIAIARREVPLPPGARWKCCCRSGYWPDAIAAARGRGGDRAGHHDPRRGR
jgi:hypothetical protein